MKTGKLVSIVLTLAMLLSVLPMSAMAYGTNYETAKVSVAFTNDDTEVATITATTYSDNRLEINIPTGIAAANAGTDKVTVSASRYLSNTTDNVDSLGYSQSYDSSLNYTNSIAGNLISLTNFNDATVEVSVIDGGETIDTATYDVSNSDSTITASPNAGSTTQAQSIWEYLSSVGGDNSTLPANVAVNTLTEEDSYAILAAGSSLTLGLETLSVTGKLTLDNFDDLDGVADNVKSNVAYSNGETDEDEYYTSEAMNAYSGVTAVLKAGSTLVVGNRSIQLKRNLTINMNGNESFKQGIIYYDEDDQGYSSNNYLSNLYDGLVNNSGSGAAEALASSINAVVDAIDAANDDVTLTFTFADATTDSAAELTGTTEGTTITTSDNVKLGDTTSSTTDSGQSVTIESGSTVTVGTTTTATTTTTDTTNDTTTTTTTEVDEYVVTNTSDETTYVYEITETTTTTSGTTTTTNETKTAITTTVDTDTVKNTTDSANASDTPSDYVNVAEVLVAAVADTTNSISDVKSITSMQIALASADDDSDAISAARSAVASDSSNSETIYTVASSGTKIEEVHPVANVYTSSNTVTPTATYPITNDQLADSASFQYTITGLTSSTTYNVYHVHSDYTVDTFENQTADTSGQVTVTLNSFSYLLSVPVTSTSDYGLQLRTISGILGDAFLLVFKFNSSSSADISGLTFKVYSDSACTQQLLLATDESTIGGYRYPAYRTETVTYTGDADTDTLGSTATSQNGEQWVFVKVFQRYLNTEYYVKAYNGDTEVAFSNLITNSSDVTSANYSFLDYTARISSQSDKYSTLNSKLIEFNSAVQAVISTS